MIRKSSYSLYRAGQRDFHGMHACTHSVKAGNAIRSAQSAARIFLFYHGLKACFGKRSLKIHTIYDR